MSARKEVTAHDLHLRSQHDILARQWPVHPAAFFLSCTVSEIAGGDFGLTLVHPITEDLRWKELQEERIIEAPVPAYKPLEDDGTVIVPAEQATEQCFRIYSVSVDKSDEFQRVAVYARVSTDDVRQTSSFELQKTYYEEFIARHPKWVLVGIYADEGISGTTTVHRTEFNRMIADAKAGKIEISRGKWIQTHFCEHGSKPLEIRHFAAVALFFNARND